MWHVVGKCLLPLVAMRTEMALLQPSLCGVGMRNAAKMVGMGLQRLVQSHADRCKRLRSATSLCQRCLPLVRRAVLARACMLKVQSAYNFLWFCYGGASETKVKKMSECVHSLT